MYEIDIFKTTFKNNFILLIKGKDSFNMVILFLKSQFLKKGLFTLKNSHNFIKKLKFLKINL